MRFDPKVIVRSAVIPRLSRSPEAKEIRQHQRTVADRKQPEAVRLESMKWLKSRSLRQSCGCPWPKHDKLP